MVYFLSFFFLRLYANERRLGPSQMSHWSYAVDVSSSVCCPFTLLPSRSGNHIRLYCLTSPWAWRFTDHVMFVTVLWCFKHAHTFCDEMILEKSSFEFMCWSFSQSSAVHVKSIFLPFLHVFLCSGMCDHCVCWQWSSAGQSVLLCR